MKLIVEPADGVEPLLSAIKKAKKTVEIAIFRFDRKDVEMALRAAAQRGVKVTALIAFVNRGGEQNLRKLELRFLDAGIIVARSNDDLIRYHDKYILIDRRNLYICFPSILRTWTLITAGGSESCPPTQCGSKKRQNCSVRTALERNSHQRWIRLWSARQIPGRYLEPS